MAQPSRLLDMQRQFQRKLQDEKSRALQSFHQAAPSGGRMQQRVSEPPGIPLGGTVRDFFEKRRHGDKSIILPPINGAARSAPSMGARSQPQSYAQEKLAARDEFGSERAINRAAHAPERAPFPRQPAATAQRAPHHLPASIKPLPVPKTEYEPEVDDNDPRRMLDQAVPNTRYQKQQPSPARRPLSIDVEAEPVIDTSALSRIKMKAKRASTQLIAKQDDVSPSPPQAPHPPSHSKSKTVPRQRPAEPEDEAEDDAPLEKRVSSATQRRKAEIEERDRRAEERRRNQKDRQRKAEEERARRKQEQLEALETDQLDPLGDQLQQEDAPPTPPMSKPQHAARKPVPVVANLDDGDDETPARSNTHSRDAKAETAPATPSSHPEPRPPASRPPPKPSHHRDAPAPPQPTRSASPPIPAIASPGAQAAPANVAAAEDEGQDKAECRICGRSFLVDRLGKHETICEKTANKKRKVFDEKQQRVAGTEAEVFAAKAEKVAAVYEKKLQAKKKDWRNQHEEFVSAIRAAKGVQEHLAKGGKLSDLPPPPVSQNPDYVKCDSCGRSFNPDVAERHIPKCAEKGKRPPPTKRK